MVPKQRDSYWYSKLDVAQQCLYRYKREFIDGVKGAQGYGDALEFGSTVHSALEAMFLGEDAQIEFKVQWEARKQLPIKYGRYKWADLYDIGKTVLAKFEKYHYPHIEPVLLEKRLYGTNSGHKTEGTPDLLGWYKGKMCAIDFKTSGQRYEKERIQVAKQLYDYVDLAIQNGHEKPTHVVYFVFVKMTKGIQVLDAKLDERFLAQVQENNKLLIDDLKERATWPRNYKQCLSYGSRCPHWDHCHGSDKDKK